MKGMYRTALALALLVGLAACSGGDRVDGLDKAAEMELQARVQELTSQLEEANASIGELRTRLAAATDPAEVEALRQRIAALEEMEEERERKAAEEEMRAKAAEMMATAMKLFDGIGTTPYAAGTATIATDGDLTITLGGEAVAIPELKADDMTVAANNGWTGKQYSGKDASPGTGTYTAVLYSNPKEGEVRDFGEFSKLPKVDDADGETGEYVVAPAGNEAKVGGSGFTHTAGAEEYELVGNERRKIITGTFDGVSGTYYCAPSAVQTCTATVASEGFTLSGGTWTFRPNAGATIPRAMDADYLAYGWWLKKDDDGWTAGAFTASMGNPTASSGLDTLEGSATYRGGAAGKYALSNARGGPNMAGHFTADVELTAKFGSAAEVTGMIDNFVTGHENDWEVSLNAANLTATGGIAADTDTTTKKATTTWMIGGEDEGTGTWTGTLFGGSSTAAPTEGTGAFGAVHGRNARMVGAFGVELE